MEFGSLVSSPLITNLLRNIGLTRFQSRGYIADSGSVRDNFSNLNMIKPSKGKLAGLELKECTLEELDDLSQSTSKTQLNRASFYKGELKGLTFQGIDFTECNLARVSFRKATFSRCKFTRVDFTRALFQGCFFSDCSFLGSLAAPYADDPQGLGPEPVRPVVNCTINVTFTPAGAGPLVYNYSRNEVIPWRGHNRRRIHRLAPRSSDLPIPADY